jgi:hypothetical protein
LLLSSSVTPAVPSCPHSPWLCRGVLFALRAASIGRWPCPLSCPRRSREHGVSGAGRRAAGGRAWLTEIIQPKVMKRDMIPVMKKTLKPEGWQCRQWLEARAGVSGVSSFVPVYLKNMELAPPDCASLENNMRAMPMKPNGILRYSIHGLLTRKEDRIIALKSSIDCCQISGERWPRNCSGNSSENSRHRPQYSQLKPTSSLSTCKAVNTGGSTSCM